MSKQSVQAPFSKGKKTNLELLQAQCEFFKKFVNRAVACAQWDRTLDLNFHRNYAAKARGKFRRQPGWFAR